jgi:hypothetical protein
MVRASSLTFPVGGASTISGPTNDDLIIVRAIQIVGPVIWRLLFPIGLIDQRYVSLRRPRNRKQNGSGKEAGSSQPKKLFFHDELFNN